MISFEDITGPGAIFVLDTNGLYKQYETSNLIGSILRLEYQEDPERAIEMMNGQVAHCSWLRALNRLDRLVVLREVSEEIKDQIYFFNKSYWFGQKDAQAGIVGEFNEPLFTAALEAREATHLVYQESLGKDARSPGSEIEIDEYGEDYIGLLNVTYPEACRIQHRKSRRNDKTDLVRKRRLNRTDEHIAINAYLLNRMHLREVCVLSRDPDIPLLIRAIEPSYVSSMEDSTVARKIHNEGGLSIICYSLK